MGSRKINILICLLGSFTVAEEAASSSWTNNLRWTLDSSTQQWHNSRTDQWLDQYVVGLDIHKVVTTSKRDVGTLILQPYVVWLPGNSGRPRPGFFDNKEAALTWRIANFNYIALPRGRLNVRLGHFELPFGLEHEINTNGTLRQYSNGANLGAKADWGIGINGRFPKWQYELGLTRGTGQEIHSRGDPYAISARIGSPFESDLAIGLSVLAGQIQTPVGVTDRKRIGADLRWMYGSFQVMAEASVGEDFNDAVRNRLAEVNWTSRDESTLVYLQHRRLDKNGPLVTDTTEVAGIGVRWLLRNSLTLAAQFNRKSTSGSQQDNSNELRIHIRFRI